MSSTIVKHVVPSLTPAPLAQVSPMQHKRTRDRSAKQQALLKAALRLFANKGFEATTTREIAAEAGCAEGLIHRYFNGKAGLLPALIESQIAKEVAELGRSLRPASKLEDEFIQLVEWEVERMWENLDYLGIFIPRAMVDASARSSLNRAVLSLRVQKVADRLRRYPAGAKLCKPEIDALAAAVGMLGLVFGFMRPVVLGQERLRAKEMAVGIARVLIRGTGCV